MSQLIAPSEALNQAFVLPKVKAQAQHPTTPSSQNNVLSTYGVLVSNIGLLLPVGTASRLVATEVLLCRVATAPSWLLGMINLGGYIVPLFDLEALLGFPPERAPAHYLVIGEGEDAAGITLTEHPQRVHLRAEQRMNRNHPLPDALQAHVRACYRVAEQIWVEWDYVGFFETVGSRI